MILILKTSTNFIEKPTILKQRFLLNEKTVNTLITLGVSMELAAKQLNQTFTGDQNPLQHKYKSGGPLSTESKEINGLIDSLKSSQKTPKVIQQTMLNEKKKDDKGTMLDESQ